MTQQWTYDDLCDGLRDSCGVEAGDLLIVHSSQAALGRVDGGVVSTVHAIKDVVTGEGTLLLPVFVRGGVLDPSVLTEGIQGVSALRPNALLGLEGLDTWTHALVWTLLFNLGLCVVVSLLGKFLNLVTSRRVCPIYPRKAFGLQSFFHFGH